METDHRFFYHILKDPETGRRMDEAIVLFFKAPHSYTGEDVVEFQVHGGRISARRIMDALSFLGVRPALPGEFTRRAFLNGRIDLSQAEAVMDVVSAQSVRAADRAQEQLGGSVGHRVNAVYEELAGICADVEATLDFDEDEVPDSLSFPELSGRVGAVRGKISALAETWHEGRLLREGALVVISGRPNAGKSALFNALLGRDRSIVTDIPGTTRDTIEESLSVDGVPIRLVDTAGLRETDSDIERQGVDRAEQSVGRADLNLRVLDATDIAGSDHAAIRGLCPDKTVIVLNKCDRKSFLTARARQILDRLESDLGLEKTEFVEISAIRRSGIDSLLKAVGRKLGTDQFGTEDVAVSARHRDLLLVAGEDLKSAERLLAETKDAVLVAQQLNLAAKSLGEITGRQISEDVLDSIFSRFCVGK